MDLKLHNIQFIFIFIQVDVPEKFSFEILHFGAPSCRILKESTLFTQINKQFFNS